MDTVQRHMAAPRELRGSGGFLRPAPLGGLRGRGDRAALGASGLAHVCQRQEGPCPPDGLPIWRRELPQRSGGRCPQEARPLRSHPRRRLGRCARGGPRFPPRLGGGPAPSLQDTDLSGGPPTRGRGRGTGADPGSIAPECALEMGLPPSRLRATVPRGEKGKSAFFPCISFVCSFPQPGEGNAGLPPELPAPGPGLPRAGRSPSRRLSPSWLLPSSPSPAGTGRGWRE